MNVEKGYRHTAEELKLLQALPLELKVEKTKLRILEWVNEFGVDGVYISFSGGKDSTVLLHIVRQMFPETEAVFVDTGLEYPEIRQFVKQFDNVKTVHPKISFVEVFKRYGYPCISKTVSHNVGVARRNPEGNVMKNCFNPEKHGQYAMYKWLPLVHADFMVSEKCCDFTKKSPAKAIKKFAITATMASESMLRRDKWIQHGCNMFDSETPKSAPMSFWTEQDVLHYIYQNNLSIAPPYGEISTIGGQMEFDCSACKLCTTAERRTGCIYCMFGCHLETGETRFQRLKHTHPKLYNYCIYGGAYDSDGIWKPDKNGLGMKHVFDELNKIYGENFIRYE